MAMTRNTRKMPAAMAVAMLSRPSAVLSSIMPTPKDTPWGRSSWAVRASISFGALYFGGIGGGGRKGDAVLPLLPGDDGQSSDVLYGGDVPQGHLLASLGGDGVVQQGGDIVVLALGYSRTTSYPVSP